MIDYIEEEKAIALILRRRDGEFQLLAFRFDDSPKAPFRLPGGGVKPGETPLDGMYREVFEEAGLERENLVYMREIGTLSYYKPIIAKRVFIHHYLFLAKRELPDSFAHTVKGDDKDRGFLWNYQWLGPGRAAEIHPELAQLINPYNLPEFFLEPDSFGLDRGKISLSETHRQWKRLYEFEEIQIRETLQGTGQTARVYHVGSTAVDDFIAKPIIDILLEWAPGTALEDIICSLEKLGYRHKGKNGIPGREFFIKGTERTTYFHLHAFARGAHEAANHKEVVSALNLIPSLKKKYREYKEENKRGDRLAYTEKKQALMKEILATHGTIAPN